MINKQNSSLLTVMLSNKISQLLIYIAPPALTVDFLFHQMINNELEKIKKKTM